MHIDVSLLTALAVFLHLGTNLAATLLHSHMDRARIDRLSGTVDSVLGTVTSLAAALNAAADPASPSPGGAGGALTVTDGGPHGHGTE